MIHWTLFFILHIFTIAKVCTYAVKQELTCSVGDNLRTVDNL